VRWSWFGGWIRDRSALFWHITQRRLVILYRRFGTTYPSHLQGSRSPIRSWPLKMGPIRCPETSAKDYHSTLRYTPGQRRYLQHRGRSLKSGMVDEYVGTTAKKLCKGKQCHVTWHHLGSGFETVRVLTCLFHKRSVLLFCNTNFRLNPIWNARKIFDVSSRSLKS
jgi:hypothetical protein